MIQLFQDTMISFKSWAHRPESEKYFIAAIKVLFLRFNFVSLHLLYLLNWVCDLFQIYR